MGWERTGPNLALSTGGQPGDRGPGQGRRAARGPAVLPHLRHGRPALDGNLRWCDAKFRLQLRVRTDVCPKCLVSSNANKSQS